jgi:CRISPR-associated protein Cmr5
MTRLTRQQQRALHAYARVEAVPIAERADYGTRVNGLGSAVLRNGLAAALAFLERDAPKPSSAAGLLLEHLSSAEIPGLTGGRGADLPGAVRRLDLRGYMLATREVLQLVVWFRRAVQASFTREEQGHVAGVEP